MNVRTKSPGTTHVSAETEIPLDTVSLKHPGRVVAVCVLAVIAAMLVHTLITNDRFGWPVVGEFLFSEQILTGLQRTLVLTVVCMAIGIVLGTVLAVFRLSENPVLSVSSALFLWFFRGTPLLIQLIFWYNLSALYPRLSIGIPFGPEFVGADTNVLISVWTAAVLGLALNEGAYMAEIIRSGLLSVSRHQTEAAKALGMTDWLLFKRIIMPQALRVIVPPTGNQVIGMLKYTSLVSIIALPELLYSAQLIYSQNFQTIPLLIVVSIWYLVFTTLLSVVQRYIEQYYGKGMTRRGRGPRFSVDALRRLVLSADTAR